MSDEKEQAELKNIKEWKAAIFPNQNTGAKNIDASKNPVEAAVMLANRAVANLKKAPSSQ